jgi:hypothetical protein
MTRMTTRLPAAVKERLPTVTMEGVRGCGRRRRFAFWPVGELDQPPHFDDQPKMKEKKYNNKKEANQHEINNLVLKKKEKLDHSFTPSLPHSPPPPAATTDDKPPFTKAVRSLNYLRWAGSGGFTFLILRKCAKSTGSMATAPP